MNIGPLFHHMLYFQAEFLRAYGATESLPPEDADIIVDNTATGT